MRKLFLFFGCALVLASLLAGAQEARYYGGRNGVNLDTVRDAVSDSLNSARPTIKFDTTGVANSAVKGVANWDTTGKALTISLGSGVSLQIGMESLSYVYNNSGVTITNGAAVYISGVYGGHRTVALAKADSWTTADFFGIATQSIPTSTFGYVNTRGYVNGLNTSAFTVNDILYLSADTAGGFTITEPTEPNFAVRCGRILIDDAATGRIGFQGRTPYRLDDIVDTKITSAVTDQVLRFNGTYWTNGTVSGGASGANGIDFFMDDTEITGTGTNNAIEIVTLSKTPITTTSTVRDSVNVTSATSPVIGEAYLYNTALGRTTIDAGIWSFSTYNSVSSTLGGRVSSITRGMYQVIPGAAGTTVSTSDSVSTIKIATLTGATVFVAADSSVLKRNASYLQTPQGLYQILAFQTTAKVVISVPSGYANETNVAYSKWKKLFNVSTGTLTTTNASVPTLNTVATTQPAFTIAAGDKIGEIVFCISNNTTTVRWYHNGSDYYTYFKSPLITLHNNLAGLQGGSTGSYYHNTLPIKLPIPTTIGSDTSGAQNDSLWIQPYFLSTVTKDSTEFHRALNEAFAGIDTVKVGELFNMPAAVDSFVVYARADSALSSVDITITGEDGTSYLSQAITPSTPLNAWQRFVFAPAAAVTPQTCRVTYRYRVDEGQYIDITAVKAKLAN